MCVVGSSGRGLAYARLGTPPLSLHLTRHELKRPADLCLADVAPANAAAAAAAAAAAVDGCFVQEHCAGPEA